MKTEAQADEKKPEEEAPQAKTPQDFAMAYEALCRAYGYEYVATPAFRPRDDGTFSVVMQFSVAKLATP